MTQTIITHFAYPDWFIEMGGHTADPDDYSEGRLDEQKEMRERQIVLVARLCSVVPFEFEMMQTLAGLFDQLDPK